MANVNSNDKHSSELYGLVLTGGKSSRMGSDKSKIDYHNKAHGIWLWELMNQLLPQSYISTKTYNPELKDFPQITDQIDDRGPLIAILSAFMTHPDSAWLVVACDLPFVDKMLIKSLIESRDSSKYATCLQSHQKDYPEPLITIWESKAYPVLRSEMESGLYCPRRILQKLDRKTIVLENDKALYNANTPEERDWAKKQIQ